MYIYIYNHICTCVCMYVCMCVYIHIYIYIHRNIAIQTSGRPWPHRLRTPRGETASDVRVAWYIHIYIYICMLYVYICICKYTYTYVCVYTYTYIYIYMYWDLATISPTIISNNTWVSNNTLIFIPLARCVQNNHFLFWNYSWWNWN